MRLKADSIIGAEMSKKYVKFLETHTKTSVNVKQILENPDYEIPSSAKCSEVCKRIENYIKVAYSPDNLPSVDILMNMFNNLNKTYSAAKDNFVKIMHIDIIKFLGVIKNKETRENLKKYLDSTNDRYKFAKADFV